MAKYDYNQTPVLRDAQVAQEIRSMAALGKFPKEIIAYGVAYYQNSQRHYMITTDPAKIIAFLNETASQAFFPTVMTSYSQRLAIPEGFEEDITRQIKLQLAQTLQKDYPEQAFRCLVELSQVEPNTSAEAALMAYRQELEGVFYTEKIRAFASLCTRAYLRKNCTQGVYDRLLSWCQKRLAQLENVVPPVDAREKVFYGMAVFEESRIKKCIVNANLSCIYQEKHQHEQQGDCISIWHRQAFAIHRQESLQAVSEGMQHILETIYDEGMIALIRQIENAPSAISDKDFAQAMAKLETLGDKAATLGRYYGWRWGLTY